MKYLVLVLGCWICLLNGYSQDLSINYNNYPNDKILSSGNLPDGKIQTAFTITNHGTAVLGATDEIYLSARINGTYYKMDLRETGASSITAGKSIGVNESFTVNPGYLDGPLTLTFLGTSSVEICVVVWGVGKASVSNHFLNDLDSCNNKSCVLYSNTVTTYSNPCMDDRSDPGGGPVTGVSSGFDDTGIVIFPVPAKDEINVYFPDRQSHAQDVVLTNMLGVVVLRKTVSGEGPGVLDVSGLADGVYVVKIYSKGKIAAIRKILVE